MTKPHVMIDLETLGTKPGSVILSIGAVKFDPMAGDLTADELVGLSAEGRTFYRRVDIESCLVAGMTIDGATIEWWFHPDRAPARKAILDDGRPWFLSQALADLRNFIGDTEAVWAHGPTFDISMLEGAYQRFSQFAPWNYRAPRCTRTVFEMADRIKPGWHVKAEPPHHALQDAIIQALDVQRAHAIIMSERLPAPAPAPVGVC